MTDDVWYYHHAGARTGPVTWDELCTAAASGDLAPRDLVWSPGMSGWTPARTVSDLVPGPDEEREIEAAPHVASDTDQRPPRTVSGHPRAPHLLLVERLLVGQRSASALARTVDDLAGAVGAIAYPVAGLLASTLLIGAGVAGGGAIPIVLGVALLPIVVLLDFAARRGVDVSAPDQASPDGGPSAPLLEGLAAVAVAVGLTAFATALAAPSGARLTAVVLGSGALLLLLYAAAVCLARAADGEERRPPGQEALELIAFLSHLVCVRLARIAFVLLSLGGILVLVWLLVLLARSNPVAVGIGLRTIPWIVGAALLPVLGALVHLAVSLLVDLLRAVLVNPAKLDEIVDGLEP